MEPVDVQKAFRLINQWSIALVCEGLRRLLSDCGLWVPRLIKITIWTHVIHSCYANVNMLVWIFPPCVCACVGPSIWYLHPWCNNNESFLPIPDLFWHFDRYYLNWFGSTSTLKKCVQPVFGCALSVCNSHSLRISRRKPAFQIHDTVLIRWDVVNLPPWDWPAVLCL